MKFFHIFLLVDGRLRIQIHIQIRTNNDGSGSGRLKNIRIRQELIMFDYYTFFCSWESSTTPSSSQMLPFTWPMVQPFRYYSKL
jgi:hypothetical protein